MFVRGQDGAGSPGANSRELESGPRAEVMLVADSGRTLAVFPTFSLPLVPPTGRLAKHMSFVDNVGVGRVALELRGNSLIPGSMFIAEIANWWPRSDLGPPLTHLSCVTIPNV